MDVITDSNTLFKKLDETQTELNEAVNAYKVFQRYSTREDISFYEWYEKNPSFSSFNYIPPVKRFDVRQSKLSNSSDSAEESASEDESPTKKVNLQSAVMIRRASRRDTIHKQNINKKMQLRNRRILGMVQSTLQRFQDETIKRQPQDLKRIKVEQKVEAAKEEEKQRLKREQIELYLKIKEKKLYLDCLKEMMVITKLFETWKCNKEKLLKCIITNTEPRIYFLPVSHTPRSKRRLEKSRMEIRENIQKQEEVMKKELAEIKASYQATHSTIMEENFAFIKTDSPSHISRKTSTLPAAKGGKKHKGSPVIFNALFSNHFH